jgi:hypothetical protein
MDYKRWAHTHSSAATSTSACLYNMLLQICFDALATDALKYCNGRSTSPPDRISTTKSMIKHNSKTRHPMKKPVIPKMILALF